MFGDAGFDGTGRSTSRPGGHVPVPPPDDTAACQQALTGTEFIFDVHTHHVIPAGPWAQNAPETVGLMLAMLPPGCTDKPQLDCVDRATYLHDLFLASDTTVAVLTDVPNSGPSNAPIPFPDAVSTQEIAAGLTAGRRQSGAGGEHHRPERRTPRGHARRDDERRADRARGRLQGVHGLEPDAVRGYSLEDPAIGLPTVQHAHDLGVKVFVAHKGLPLVNFDPAFNHPDDVVAVSRQFPDMNFVIYHAAWDPSHVEGPYDPTATVGIDTLLAALDRHGVPPNDNVWVDMATMWRQLLTQPDQAAHALGKMLSRVGEQTGAVGDRRHLVRQPPAADHGHAGLPDHPRVPGALRLPRADRRDQGAPSSGSTPPQLFGIDPDATRCGLTERPADGQHRRGGVPARTRVPSPRPGRRTARRRAARSWTG